MQGRMIAPERIDASLQSSTIIITRDFSQHIVKNCDALKKKKVSPVEQRLLKAVMNEAKLLPNYPSLAS